MDVIDKHEALVRRAHGAYAEDVLRYRYIEDQILILRTQGATNATPYWRKDKEGEPKYLYLIHPATLRRTRKREYIGCESENIVNALELIKRQAEINKYDLERRRLNLKLKRANHYLIKYLQNMT